MSVKITMYMNNVETFVEVDRWDTIREYKRVGSHSLRRIGRYVYRRQTDGGHIVRMEPFLANGTVGWEAWVKTQS